MLSVKGRIKKCTQPRNGYIPRSSLTVISYEDDQKVNVNAASYSAYSSIQGTAVDYLTRMLSGVPIEKAFEIPLLGAKVVKEKKRANAYLKQIKGLDYKSILAACKLVGYDVAYRRGEFFYTDVKEINPNRTILHNVKVMVNRGLKFLVTHKPLVSTGFTFEGGYTSLISSGDGDFLTEDGLWDFKVSLEEPTSSETLQILVYYILGYHSVHPEFKHIKRIGLFNPLKNQSYEIKIEDIPEIVLKEVSHNVIGYRFSDEKCHWYETDGEDDQVLKDYLQSVFYNNKGTDFDPDKYKDGIHDITVNDYWTYFRDKSDRYIFDRPKFSKTNHVKFLKNSGFLMFVSVSARGSNCILNGGGLRKLNKPLDYYYNRLPEYGERVLSLFSKYWDSIYSISDFIRDILPSNMSPRVHGCIVDMDFYHHIFLNPLDGSITPYFATSMYMRKPYSNLASLISAQRPDLLPAFKKKQEKAPQSLALMNSATSSSIIALSEEAITQSGEIVYDTDMYTISNKLKALQQVYDYHLITVWYDSLLSQVQSIEERTNQMSFSKKEDSQIEDVFDQIIKIKKNEKNISRSEFRSLIWETIIPIKQPVLFALIRKFVKDNQLEICECDEIFFEVEWWNKRSFSCVSVMTSFDDILLFYTQLFKERKKYNNTIRFQIDISGTKKKKTSSVAVIFWGGQQDPLALNGDYIFKNGRLFFSRRLDKKTKF